ncbi:MAG: hypothetical protein IKQ93_05815 [Candidatus Methanomethylophilaceae archaeon]|nr:hypothetical protein [Candidatus Methanomethylophilaceae archaeon]
MNYQQNLKPIQMDVYTFAHFGRLTIPYAPLSRRNELPFLKGTTASG